MEFINIIINQKTNYHIVHSKESTECERYACSELQKYLYQSLNYPVPIFSDKCPKRGPEILIGNARNNNYMKLLEGKTKEAFLIKEVDENIIITGNSPRAILYGVYKFLEEFIGFRCFTKDCETYEKLEELKKKL
jgi:alpha-glucuronidase